MSNPFFLPYQQRWIQDSSRIKLMEKSRQVGISWATAYSLVRRQSQDTNTLHSWVSSRDEAQAKLFLQDCKSFAHSLNLAATDLGTQVLSDKKTSSMALAFNNNTSIHSLSSNPDAQAGKRGSRVLDEFALHPDPKQLYAIAYPGITWGGQLEIISTHRGSHNFFNKLIQEIKFGGNPKNISHHRVTLEDALDDGFLQKLKAKLPLEDERQLMDDADYFNFIKNSCPDHETFLQEYMCQPSDERSLFIPPNLYAPCFYADDVNWEYSLQQIKNSPNDFTLGIDLGRDHDLTVFALIEKIEDTLYIRQILCLENTPFNEQERVLHQFLSCPNIRRVAIDQTGIGRQFTEQAMQRFAQGRIEGVTFTASIKEHLAFLLRSTLETKSIRIPNDDFLCADLRAIKKEITSAGNLRFCADRGLNGHADRFWALALALYAAKDRKPTPFYESLSPLSKRY